MAVEGHVAHGGSDKPGVDLRLVEDSNKATSRVNSGQSLGEKAIHRDPTESVATVQAR